MQGLTITVASGLALLAVVAQRASFADEPVRVYLVPTTHMDIDYTAPPEESMRRYAEFVSRAVTACDGDPMMRYSVQLTSAAELFWQTYPAQRDAFWRSLKRAGARAYFCGHDHFFNQARVDDGDGNPDNDVHQFVVATAGAPSYAWVPPYDGDNGDFIVTQVYHAERYGYILVEVDDLDVTMTWMERHSQDMLEPGVYRPAYVWSYRVASNPADPCPVKLTADLNGDCRVDFADLAILAGEWLAGDVPTGPADGIPK